ncbi:hypothetical protein CgunFtcFv8_026238 [Champsocephalus gunnari]|uniref:Uncharacterized protein n=1 Tax=Champsocephalus gunnari TaxID=52237 RepID=A0AAN8H442_CHAGU|nr:hypothetical protein CgunFtcFv8_026238 [Champsocephalus gunnari]
MLLLAEPPREPTHLGPSRTMWTQPGSGFRFEKQKPSQWTSHCQPVSAVCIYAEGMEDSNGFDPGTHVPCGHVFPFWPWNSCPLWSCLPLLALPRMSLDCSAVITCSVSKGTLRLFHLPAAAAGETLHKAGSDWMFLADESDPALIHARSAETLRSIRRLLPTAPTAQRT